MGLRFAGLVALVWLLQALAAQPARAQALDGYLPEASLGNEAFRLDTVQSRNRSDFDDKGITLGSITVRPVIEELLGYNDNILGSTQRLASPEVETKVSVAASTDWARNGLSASLSTDDVRYLDKPLQSFTNWEGTLAGMLDLGRDKLTMSYKHQSLNLGPSEIDNLIAGVPIPFTVDDVHATYLTDLNRFTITSELAFTHYQFDDVVVGGVTDLSRAGDRNVYSGSVTGAYEFDSSRKLVAILRSSYSDFTALTGTAGGVGITPRNNVALTALAGVDYTANGLFRYRLLAGYAARFYANSAQSSIMSPVIEASVIWTPERVTTVTATVSRRIEDAIDASIIGYTYTQGSFIVDHEIRRDLLLQGRASGQLADYAQSGGTQTIYSVGAGLQYFLNRNARLTANYDVSLGHDPSSNTGNTPLRGSYQRDLVLIGLRLQL